jgi:hypothetical protein
MVLGGDKNKTHSKAKVFILGIKRNVNAESNWLVGSGLAQKWPLF